MKTVCSFFGPLGTEVNGNVETLWWAITDYTGCKIKSRQTTQVKRDNLGYQASLELF